MDKEKNIDQILASLKKTYDTLKEMNPDHKLLSYAGPYLPTNGIYFKKEFTNRYGTNHGDGQCYKNYKNDLESALRD
jgi:hypothetical protein